MAPGNSAVYADAISMFGNEFTKNTYGTHAFKVHQVPMSVTTEPEIIEGRNYTKAKKRFLWLNSHGALLKGLDMVLEAFMMRPELQLFVCGNTGRDAEFMNTMQSRIAHASNITMEGWVDMKGERFKTLVAECGWVVSASFSEGGGGSILNAMAKGLIPVISTSSSITLPRKTGFYLENNNAASIVDLLKTVSELPDDELREMSLNAVNFIATHHTLEIFKSKYKDFLIEVTSSVNG
jgi:glycosyltransferase involved in cell wall biosynthesis